MQGSGSHRREAAASPKETQLLGGRAGIRPQQSEPRDLSRCSTVVFPVYGFSRWGPLWCHSRDPTKGFCISPRAAKTMPPIRQLQQQNFVSRSSGGCKPESKVSMGLVLCMASLLSPSPTSPHGLSFPSVVPLLLPL